MNFSVMEDHSCCLIYQTLNHFMCTDELNARTCVVILQLQQYAKCPSHLQTTAWRVCVCVCLQSLSPINMKPIISLLGKCLLALCSILMNNGTQLCSAKQRMIYATLKSLCTLPFSASPPKRLLGISRDKLGITK